MIDRKNYDEYLVDYLEGQLNENEEQELFEFLDMYPELNTELENFKMTFLVPDESVLYHDKENLKKDHRRKIAFLPFYRYAAVAATIVIAIGLFFLFTKKGEVTSLRFDGFTSKEVNIPSANTIKADSSSPKVDITNLDRNTEDIGKERSGQAFEIAEKQQPGFNIHKPINTTDKEGIEFHESIASILQPVGLTEIEMISIYKPINESEKVPPAMSTIPIPDMLSNDDWETAEVKAKRSGLIKSLFNRARNESMIIPEEPVFASVSDVNQPLKPASRVTTFEIGDFSFYSKRNKK